VAKKLEPIFRHSEFFWRVTWGAKYVQQDLPAFLASNRGFDSIPNDSPQCEVVSRIFRTGAAIYTALVVAQRICPNKSDCEFRVLLQTFEATAWKRAKTSPRTSVRTDLVASPWQRPVSHFRSHPAFSGKRQNGCHPPPTVLPWFGTLWFLPIYKKKKKKFKLKGRWFDTTEDIHAESQRVLDTRTEKDFQEAFQKSKLWDRCLHVGGNFFEGDGGR
jgi:hypothetical protein